MTYCLLVLASALAAPLGSPLALHESRPVDVETAIELLDHAALQLALEELARAHPDRVQLLPVGTSRSGLEFSALRITAGEAEAGRPALLLVANVDAHYAYTSTLALHHARALAAGYGEDERVTKLLDATTIYVIPRADPDGAEARFETPLRESDGTGPGVDNDRDGHWGEDGRLDVNGDGYITVMRVLDPEGTWVEDPTEPRVLIEAARGEGQRGKWKLLPEGRDQDGDGRVAEDPPLDAVVNRNFAHAWEEHAPAAGRYPTDEPEARALCEFVLAHPDIAAVLTYGAQGNLVGKPKVAKPGGRRGDEVLGFFEEDAKRLEEIGKRYRELTKNETEGLGQQPGSFQAWCYHHRGLWTFDIVPWSVPDKEPKRKAKEKPEEATDEGAAAPAEAAPSEGEADDSKSPDPKMAGKAPKPSKQANQLRWLEAQGITGAFLDWTAFEHPELGPVEIGGFAPYALLEPSLELLGELCQPHFEFLLGLGELLPRVRLVEFEARALADGLIELTGALENDALLPYVSAAAGQGRSRGAIRPLRVRLELPAGATLLGGKIQELVPQLAAAGGRHELRWLVQTADPGALRVSVDSDHALSGAATPEVK